MTEVSPRRQPKKLSPETKWEILLQVTGGEISQADAARKWQVDVSTVIGIRRTVKDAALAALARAPGRPAKERNWELERWGPVDRSHRRLAHRGSYEGLVWVAPSTFRRVLAAHGLVLPELPARTRSEKKPWPEWLVWEPNRIWIYDATHFTRCRRVVFAIVDMVSRKWIDTLTSVEESATQVQVIFEHAPRARRAPGPVDRRASRPCHRRSRKADPARRVRQRSPDGRAGHTGVHDAPGDRPAPGSPAHPHRPGLDRDAVRAHQRRVAPPRGHHRPDAARGRAGTGAHRVHHRAAARSDRLRHTRRRAGHAPIGRVPTARSAGGTVAP